ncbi:hypothetical protein NDU88_005798 [Pleurodeles waltl]|uniref:Secreted protein n=1 Tax=Pleurodeles waltl TaxID=8319 RepID=A0AAV7NNU5_PLEWA|nr:hypothetical protein NDU88_005796 [Pleurodeles waltl]KAJ1117601.1 hypothetical protein NDU88_005798 [Pleurodeles waltl]
MKRSICLLVCRWCGARVVSIERLLGNGHAEETDAASMSVLRSSPQQRTREDVRLLSNVHEKKTDAASASVS